jgi:ribosome maturation factor RimP
VAEVCATFFIREMPDLKLIEQAVEGLLAQEGVELVDLRYLMQGGRWVLRFYLDKHRGITLDDCEYLSDRIGALLDTMDIIPHAYTLEVSSPGLDRVLKKDKDFMRFAGHRVRVRLKNQHNGQRNFSGYLKGFENGSIVLDIGERTLCLELSWIEEARLDPEIEV